ncbi:MAG: RNA polymerase sigma factor [Longimicrobiales bacterium]
MHVKAVDLEVERQRLRPSLPPAPVSGSAKDAVRIDQGGELPPDFEVWFKEHRQSVYRYVRFRVATREVAEDLTSEVFFKALRSLSRYDPKRSAPRTWLLRIARNAITDHLRGLRRRGSLHVSLDRVPDLVSNSPSQEERLLKEERVQRLLNATAELRESDQEILSLRYGAGLGNREIASTMDISSNAVAVRLHRALQRLKDAVSEAQGDQEARGRY